MISHLRVQGFKSLHDVDVDLAPLVVLFGPNASGKSNLLEAILLLARMGTEQTVADAFERPLRGYPLEAFELPSDGLKGLLAQDEAELSIQADVRSTPAKHNGQPRFLRYRASVAIEPQTGKLELRDEYLARLNKNGNPTGNPRIESKGDHLAICRIEKGAPQKQPLPWHHTALSNRQFSGRLYPDFDELRGELSAWLAFYLDPLMAMRFPRPPRQVSDIGFLGQSTAPFLFRLKQSEEHIRYFRAIERALRSAIPTVESLDVDLDKQRGTLDIQIQQDGTTYSSRVISEGTLRVLALCAIAGTPWAKGLVAFEEPENGVHPRRIEVIADLLESIGTQDNRQVVVTTHSPTLVATMIRKQRENPGRTSVLVCSRDGRTTHVEPFAGVGPLFDDKEIATALSDDEDSCIEAMLKRGWLDG